MKNILSPAGSAPRNLHAIYLESGKFVERDEITPEHFENWMDWAEINNSALDFNPTFFSHKNVLNGLTLSSPDKSVRDFWIRHGKCCRKIAAEFGRRLGKRCVMNTWVPDGFKDTPVDRAGARMRLAESLDAMFAEKMQDDFMRDAVESKLFGIGVESCTVGSHEFYMGYAAENKIMLTLDSGHFHPTEIISDKISSCLMFVDEILLHVSRGVRWDSDHVVLFDDELQAIGSEIIRAGANKVNIGLDYFDGTINRVAAWVTGVRNMQKALLKALLSPDGQLRKFENEGDFTSRLVLTEEMKSLPYADVYEYYLLKNAVPGGADVLKYVKDYEHTVLAGR